MVETISTARLYAQAFRFSGDQEVYNPESSISPFVDASNLLYKHELAISGHVTPGLERSINQVCGRLHLPRSSFDAFVYSSSEIQASCIILNSDRFAIRVSSGLVDLLDEDEFKFVIGHEIAHFIFSHQLALSKMSGSIELYLLQRSQEISADRLGLISCNSLEVATRTLMKSLSGLSSKHLRFDVREFVDQSRRSASHSGDGEIFLTHPSMVVRCRGLLWFSGTNLISYELGSAPFDAAEREKVDERIQIDLDKFVNGPARQEIERAKSDLGLWIAATRIIERGRFSREDQMLVSQIFGEATAQSLKGFFSDINSDEIGLMVSAKLQEARNTLALLIPLSFLKEYQRVESRIAGIFSL